MQHRRSPLIAGILALLAPGLGHVYSGRARRGILLAVGLVLVIPLAVLLILYLPWRPWNVVLPVLLIVSAPVAVVIDAVLQARRTSAWEPAWYNRWYVYAALTLIAVFAVEPAMQRALRSRVRTFTITSASMAPTLLAGDYVAVTPGPAGAIARGDVVLYRTPEGVDLLKRVVGLPGDTVEMRDRLLIVNGTPLDEPYVQILGEPDLSMDWMAWQRPYVVPGGSTSHYLPTRDSWGPLAIPPGQYFMLGDNRDESLDSRFVGFVPSTIITGRPRRTYFSRDQETGTIRWSRIGLALFEN